MRLHELAESFAQQLNDTVEGVITGVSVSFTAHLRRNRRGPSQAWVSTFAASGSKSFSPLLACIGGRQRLEIHVDFRLSWDRGGEFLKVVSSDFRVRPIGRTEDLWRYAYVHDSQWKPAAHLHVHAHRDEVTHLVLEGRRRRANDLVDGKPVHCGVAELHFPLGGDRFRPCLEDVLQMLVEEFKVDTAPGWMTQIDEGRRRWRAIQLQSAVRDDPGLAVQELERLGYVIHAPAEEREPNPRRLRY